MGANELNLGLISRIITLNQTIIKLYHDIIRCHAIILETNYSVFILEPVIDYDKKDNIYEGISIIRSSEAEISEVMAHSIERKKANSIKSKVWNWTEASNLNGNNILVNVAGKKEDTVYDDEVIVSSRYGFLEIG